MTDQLDVENGLDRARDALATSMGKWPPWVRQTIALASAFTIIASALGQVAGVLSFLAQRAVSMDLWHGFLAWAQRLPDYARVAIAVATQAAHWLVKLYHGLWYPLFDYVAPWIPFRIPTWAYDIVFVLIFSLVAVNRLAHRRYDFTADLRRAPLAIWRAGLFAPLALIWVIGALVISLPMHLLSSGKYGYDLMRMDTYWNLPPPWDDMATFLECALAIAVAMYGLLLFDWAYLHWWR